VIKRASAVRGPRQPLLQPPLVSGQFVAPLLPTEESPELMDGIESAILLPLSYLAMVVSSKLLNFKLRKRALLLL
jgi:hypothetical protein